MEDGRVSMSERGRFAHRQVQIRSHLYWDLLTPVHYTDGRPMAALAGLAGLFDPTDLYRRNGTALDPTHTLVQLLIEPAARLERAGRLLMLADLFGYWMTGVAQTDVTIASTTGLLGLDGRWDVDIARQLGVPARLLAPLRHPGELAGQLGPAVATEAGLDGSASVRIVAGHDTASAVAAVPCDGATTFAFISVGTWSLVGVELEYPVLSDDARLAGFTNELGVGGRVRLRQFQPRHCALWDRVEDRLGPQWQTRSPFTPAGHDNRAGR